jgi:hypothetical protein
MATTYKVFLDFRYKKKDDTYPLKPFVDKASQNISTSKVQYLAKNKLLG